MTSPNHAYRLSFAAGSGPLEMKGFTSITGPAPIDTLDEIRALFDALPQVTELALCADGPIGRRSWAIYKRHAVNEV